MTVAEMRRKLLTLRTCLTHRILRELRPPIAAGGYWVLVRSVLLAISTPYTCADSELRGFRHVSRLR